MRKILHWNIRFGTSIGGGEIYVSNIIQNMPEFDHQVLSDSSRPKRENIIYAKFQKNIHYSGPPKVTNFKWINFPINVLNNMVRLRNKIKIYEKINPDLNIIHGIGIFGTLERLFFITGIDLLKNNYFQKVNPKILTVHNLYSPIIKKNNKRYINYENKVFEQFSTFICIDKNIFDILRKKFPSKKIYFVPNSIPDYFFNDDKEKKVYDYKSPVVGFVGRYEHSRGIHILKKMVEKAPKNFKFLLIFSTNDLTKQKIKKEFSRKKNVELYYNIPNKNLVSYYQKMDFLFNPVLAKGISRVTLEGMSSEVIPIMLDLGDRYPIEDGKTGILFTEEKLYDLIERIKNLPGVELKKIQKNARKISKEKYSNSIIMKKLRKIYNKHIQN